MLTSDTAVALQPSDAALNGSLQKGLLGLIDIASLGLDVSCQLNRPQ